MKFAKWYLEIMKVVRSLVGLRLLGTDTQHQEEESNPGGSNLDLEAPLPWFARVVALVC